MITLNHTIVPVRDQARSAEFYTRIFGFRNEPPLGSFTVLRVNDSLTLDLAEQEVFESHHYAFQVNDAEFDAILDRVRQAGLAYSADPFHDEIGQLNTRRGGRGFYVCDPDGHNLELLTRS